MCHFYGNLGDAARMENAQCAVHPHSTLETQDIICNMNGDREQAPKTQND